MPFDDARFNATAIHGDVAGVTIKVSIALDSVALALEAIKSGGDISPHVAEIRKRSQELNDSFDALTGYTPAKTP